MSAKTIWLGIGSVAALIVVAFVAAPYVMVALISSSHVEGNVPASEEFDRYLTRDLQSYFESNLRRKVVVRHELLRTAPTQSGVAFPKYYLWARVFDGSTQLDEGAVRVAAIDRSRFEVTDFLSQRDIKANPATVKQVFPAPLVEGILARAGIS